MGPIVVTGAGGFVGRRLVALLSERGEQVVALCRRLHDAPALAGVRWVAAELAEPCAYEAALAGADAVIHLAAVTGKARASAFARDVEITRTLIAASARAGVGRFVFVSSIAAGFASRQAYHYAEAKIAAEAIVAGAPLDAVIVRPTMILGEGSPIQASLARLACLPLTPVFGDGEVRVQPIDVGDVAAFLAAVACEESAAGQVIEIGGPCVLSMNALLQRIRAEAGKEGRMRALHVPLGPLRAALALIEAPLLPVLPFTAGQMATFANDSVARPHKLAARLLAGARETPPRHKPAGKRARAAPETAEADEVLAEEFRRLTRYLTGMSPSAYQCAKYCEAHRRRNLAPAGAFDSFLVRRARGSGLGRALADAYAGAFARQSALRAKMMLALAILEASPPSFAALDTPAAPGGRALAALPLRTAVAGLALAAALVLYAPVHIWLGATGRAR